jgi:uncharacterized membrane protein
MAQAPAAAGKPTGWMIGVMVELPGEAVPIQHFFAVGHEDRAHSEWKAVDQALLIGRIASSPVRGLEPVHCISALPAQTLQFFALKPGEVRPLGAKLSRRWASL